MLPEIKMQGRVTNLIFRDGLLPDQQTIYNLAACFKIYTPVGRKNIVIAIFFMLIMVSCDKPPVEKPKVLVGEREMIDMLVDIHLAEATFNVRRYRDSLVERSSSINFYSSVLEKYQVPDSVFERSFVYYASRPRRFEKLYRQTMNKLNEMEQDYSGSRGEMKELELKRGKR